MPAKELFIRNDLAALFAGKDAFDVITSMEGEEFRALESRRTIAVIMNTRRYFVKYHRGIPNKEIFKNLIQLRLPVVSARNEWQSLSKLKALGIKVPNIAAYGKRGWLPQTCESFIITDDVGTQETLEDYSRDWKKNPPLFRDKLAIIKEIAATSRLMHTSGICHRDFYICHFMMTGNEGQDDKGGMGSKEHKDHKDQKGGQKESSSGSVQNKSALTLIDLHRALLKRNLGTRWIIKDIGSLYFSAMDIGLTRHDLFRFIRDYSGLSLKAVFTLDQQHDFWDAVQKRARKLKSRHP